ncbi:MAG: IS3 family transposase [Lachnospiraceae bacterium]|nr:IS3 family transposase [Lachnospiraceae bacterium]
MNVIRLSGVGASITIPKVFANLKELKLKLWDYVNWYNNHKIHSSLGYQTPVQYRENNLKKLPKKCWQSKY